MKYIPHCLLSLALLAGQPALVCAEDANTATANAEQSRTKANHNGARRSGAVNFSSRYQNFSIERAYQLQRAFVHNQVRQGARMVGFKAGLTGVGEAQKFGLDEPLTGVLIHPPKVGENIVINRQYAQGLMLELELVFKLAETVDRSLEMAELRQKVAAVAPAIELPDLNFTGENFTGLDVIANNAMAYKSIVGEWQSIDDLDLDAIEVSLACDGDLLVEGKASNAMGSQWQALLWMVNHLVSHGYSIQPGQILMTGTLTGILPAEPCDYVADYAELGMLTFTIE